MHTVSEIADAIGRRKIADTLNLGVTAVSNAVVRGTFPASWFLAIGELCEERGIECPPSLFNMVVPERKMEAPKGSPEAAE